MHCNSQMDQLLQRLERIETALNTAPKEYLDTQGAARFLGISTGQLEEWRSRTAGGPPYHKFGRAVRYAIKDLREFANSGRVEAM